jgi:hypothetical protein
MIINKAQQYDQRPGLLDELTYASEQHSGQETHGSTLNTSSGAA